MKSCIEDSPAPWILTQNVPTTQDLSELGGTEYPVCWEREEEQLYSADSDANWLDPTIQNLIWQIFSAQNDGGGVNIFSFPPSNSPQTLSTSLLLIVFLRHYVTAVQHPVQPVAQTMATDSQEKKPADAPVVLSEGAGVALGSVFNRLVKPKSSRGSRVTGKKRPRSEKASVVLAENEDVQKSLAEEKKLRKEYKEAKKAKLQFENNALVIPDAATNAALEKDLLATATKGAVALFNAVAKAQKMNEDEKGSNKKKGPPVSRESFMSMMRAGVSKDAASDAGKKVEEEGSSDEEASAMRKQGAKWLKNDFLTAGSTKLKDFDREAPVGEESSSSDDESSDDEDNQSSDSDSD